jgi:putative DNA primase/helicase
VRLDAAAIHAALAGRWRDILVALGIAPEYLRNRHGPCPRCGGTDRFRFDDRGGRGTWICNHCGAGDGFKLVLLVHGVGFAEARRMVIGAAGLRDEDPRHWSSASRPNTAPPTAPVIATPSARVRRLLSSSCRPGDVPAVVEYLGSRSLWPLPSGCTLRAHVAADYAQPAAEPDAMPEHVGRFPAILARVVDVNDELVTVHATYLADGRKLDATRPGLVPRKLLTKLTGRRGCVVRLMPLDGDTLGIAEGLETALAAHVLHGVPVWAALNTSVLAKFKPPPGVHHVIIFADRDVGGLEAALALTAELEGLASVETRTPRAPTNDWADVLAARTDV